MAYLAYLKIIILFFKSLTNYSFLDIEEALVALGWPDKSKRKEKDEKTPNPLRKKTSKPYQALGDFRSIRKKQLTDADGVIRHLIQKPNKIDGKRYGIPQGFLCLPYFQTYVGL